MTFQRESHRDLPSAADTSMFTKGLEAVPLAELQTCLRDLMGLLALPSLWSGRDPDAILRILAEALEGILSIEACYVTAAFDVNESPISLLRVVRQVVASDSAAWAEFTHARTPALSQDAVITLAETPCGSLRVARLAMSYSGHAATVAVGSSRSDFPRPAEVVLLRAAASLAASGLRAARLVQEREEALRAKDEFLAMLGHELRNPLAPIVTALEVMKLRSSGELPQEQQIIERQVGNLTALVNDLLDVARVTRGKIELKKAPVDIATIVSKAVETARPLLEQRRHHLRVEVSLPTLVVDADPMRLSQVVANLLMNAAKYTEPGGNIVVTASRAAGQARLSIKDNGMGIDAQLLSRVFDLFQQGRVTIDRAAGGLGIGLAIVKSLVALHGGSVSAYSEGPGRGSEFIVSLPLREAEDVAATDGGSAIFKALPVSELYERVLVVDDNRDAAELTAELVRSVGHEATVAYDAPEALALSESFRPTVMVLDIGLPVIDGYQLAMMIRERWGANAPRMIALTGYGLAHDRLRSREAGVEIHLVKPVRLETLLAAIQNKPLPSSE